MRNSSRNEWWRFFASVPRLKHNQAEPLALIPLQQERVNYFYNLLEKDKKAFDDYTPLNRQEIEDFLFGPNSVSFEIGDGVGLCTLVFSGVNAYVQMVMFDWFYRDYICHQVIEEAFSRGAERITSTVTEDRNNARHLVLSLGFRYEGTLRKAFYRDGPFADGPGKYFDIELYGLSKEAWYGNRSNDSSGSDIGSGSDRGRSSSFSGSEQRG